MSKILKKVAQVHDSITIEVSKTRQEDDGPYTVYVDFESAEAEVLSSFRESILYMEELTHTIYGLPKPTEDIEHEVISTKIKR